MRVLYLDLDLRNCVRWEGFGVGCARGWLRECGVEVVREPCPERRRRTLPCPPRQLLRNERPLELWLRLGGAVGVGAGGGGGAEAEGGVSL